MVKNSKFFRTLWPTLQKRLGRSWRFCTRMCAGLCPTYWTTFGVAEKNRNGSCPQHEWDHPPFFEFLIPPPPGADGPHRGRGHVGRHCPYTNNIWCGSVHALLRYGSKTAKMQKFPVDSHSNENFICPFFRPPGAANPQKGRRHIRNLRMAGKKQQTTHTHTHTHTHNKHYVQ